MIDMNNIDGILFDLDGTLWDTVDSVYKTLKEMKEEYSDITKPISKKHIINSMGFSFEQTRNSYFGYLPKEVGTKYTIEMDYRNSMRLSIYGGKLYPNVKKTLNDLSKKYKLFVVSNCSKEYLEAFLDKTGVRKYFTDYESGGNTGLSKSENIKLVVKRNNLLHPIYVGDTIIDKDSSSEAGVQFVYASYGFGNISDYEYKIDEFKDLLNL